MNMGYSARYKPNRGRDEDMEFPGVLKNTYQIVFSGFDKKRNGTSRGDKDKIIWNFQRF